MKNKWICLQLGMREHYSVPRALYRNGSLAGLCTDLWAGGCARGAANFFHADRVLRRFHKDLRGLRVKAINLSTIYWELWNARILKKKGWNLVYDRNQRFQRHAASYLRKNFSGHKDIILFSYSYTALEPFRFAKEMGWKTVLGQIDPGLWEEKKIREESEKTGIKTTQQNAPQRYWDDWKEECELADHIIVNSEWSRQGLVAEGIPENKISVIPLAYEPLARDKWVRRYPKKFSFDRKMRVLFLGQVNLRKGIHYLIEAARMLLDQPIEFWVVGPVQIGLSDEVKEVKNIQWVGNARGVQVDQYYQNADVFLFPTLSDGFGLTQLEAQSWGLPIIASKFCGEVVENDINGIVLSDVSAASICEALLRCIENPNLLNNFSTHAIDLKKHSLDMLANKLEAVSEAV